MATKTYCDGCGGEITERSFSHCAGPLIPYHIVKGVHTGHSKRVTNKEPPYSSEDFHPYSGRCLQRDLCLICSNEVYQAAMDQINKIKDGRP